MTCCILEQRGTWKTFTVSGKWREAPGRVNSHPGRTPPPTPPPEARKKDGKKDACFASQLGVWPGPASGADLPSPAGPLTGLCRTTQTLRFSKITVLMSTTAATESCIARDDNSARKSSMPMTSLSSGRAASNVLTKNIRTRCGQCRGGGWARWAAWLVRRSAY